MPVRKRTRKSTHVLPAHTMVVPPCPRPLAIVELSARRFRALAVAMHCDDLPFGLVLQVHRKRCDVTMWGDDADCTCIPTVLTLGASA